MHDHSSPPGTGDTSEERLLRLAAEQGWRCALPMMLGLVATASVGARHDAVGAAGVLAAGLLLVVWRRDLRAMARDSAHLKGAAALKRALTTNVALGGWIQAVAFVTWHPGAASGQQALLALSLGMALAGAAHCVVIWRPALPWLLLPPLSAMGWLTLRDATDTLPGWHTLLALAALASAALMASRLHAAAVRDALEASMSQEALVRDLACQRDAATRLAQAKSDFLGMMSHEIRTPLHGLLAGLEIASRADNASDRSRWLAAAEASGRSLLELLNAVLEQARLGTQPRVPSLQAIELRRLLDSTASLFDALASSKGIALGVDVSPDARGSWCVDPVMLKQVLANLVGNAIKFTRSGSVRLELRRQAHDAGVQIDVVDTGRGIPSHALPFIFEPFYRVPVADAGHGGSGPPGAGLGLSITQGLVRAMGGSITAESQVGQGTRVSVTLPLRRAEACDTSTGPTPRGPVGRSRRNGALRVLLAEDNEVIALITTEILTQEGFEVSHSADGGGALRARMEQNLDVILMDIQMPEMDGLQAARAIRQWESDHGAMRVPIAVVSASVDAARLQAIGAAGVDDWIEKPFTRKKLLSLIARLSPRSNEGHASRPTAA